MFLFVMPAATDDGLDIGDLLTGIRNVYDEPSRIVWPDPIHACRRFSPTAIFAGLLIPLPTAMDESAVGSVTSVLSRS